MNSDWCALEQVFFSWNRILEASLNNVSIFTTKSRDGMRRHTWNGIALGGMPSIQLRPWRTWENTSFWSEDCQFMTLQLPLPSTSIKMSWSFFSPFFYSIGASINDEIVGFICFFGQNSVWSERKQFRSKIASGFIRNILLYFSILCYTLLFFAILCYIFLLFATICYTLLFWKKSRWKINSARIWAEK